MSEVQKISLLAKSHISLEILLSNYVKFGFQTTVLNEGFFFAVNSRLFMPVKSLARLIGDLKIGAW